MQPFLAAFIIFVPTGILFPKELGPWLNEYMYQEALKSGVSGETAIFR